MFLYEHFKEMLSALNDADAEYLVVGGYAMAAHGNPRATGDIDIWVRPEPENAKRVFSALEFFRAPLDKMSADDFAESDVIYQMGVPPQRIDIITSIDGVEFVGAWGRRLTEVIDGVSIGFLSEADLLASKLASGRPKDLGDADWLQNRRRLDSPD